MDVYVGKSSSPPTFTQEPNMFQYEMCFKSVNRLNLNSSNYQSMQAEDGYSVTIFVHGFDERENNLLRNSIVVSFEALSLGLQVGASLLAISSTAAALFYWTENMQALE